MGYLDRAFPKRHNPYKSDVSYVTTRDGKRLPVDHTLEMAQMHIAGTTSGAEKGLAMALEAALLEVKRLQAKEANHSGDAGSTKL